jgi:lipase chaperone LimK
LRKNTRKVFEKKYSKYFQEKSSVKVSEKYLRNFFEKFPRKKYSKSLREKIFEKFSRINSQNLFDIFCGPILGPIGGPRVKLKDRGLGL